MGFMQLPVTTPVTPATTTLMTSSTTRLPLVTTTRWKLPESWTRTSTYSPVAATEVPVTSTEVTVMSTTPAPETSSSPPELVEPRRPIESREESEQDFSAATPRGVFDFEQYGLQDWIGLATTITVILVLLILTTCLLYKLYKKCKSCCFCRACIDKVKHEEPVELEPLALPLLNPSTSGIYETLTRRPLPSLPALPSDFEGMIIMRDGMPTFQVASLPRQAFVPLAHEPVYDVLRPTRQEPERLAPSLQRKRNKRRRNRSQFYINTPRIAEATIHELPDEASKGLPSTSTTSPN